MIILAYINKVAVTKIEGDKITRLDTDFVRWDNIPSNKIKETLETQYRIKVVEAELAVEDRHFYITFIDSKDDTYIVNLQRVWEIIGPAIIDFPPHGDNFNILKRHI